jgi:tetratricopeptide (TPR) repeat protein
LEAFDFRQTDKIEMASTLDLLGCIRLALLDVEAANNNFREALQLRLKSLSKINPNHPDIGISYHNLGEANSQTFNFSDAEVNYSRAAEIYRHNYPPLHPLVRGINKCLEKVQQQLR